MLPLVIASGAGAASRQAVGTGVMGSMLTATVFGIFFTPLFFVAAGRWLGGGRREAAATTPELGGAGPVGEPEGG
jgi:multidrug efflux pump